MNKVASDEGTKDADPPTPHEMNRLGSAFPRLLTQPDVL
jgi:hypothetical protein